MISVSSCKNQPNSFGYIYTEYKTTDSRKPIKEFAKNVKY